MKIALVIKPSKTLSNKVYQYKSKFKKKFSKCLYIKDFPHLTLFTCKVSLTESQLKKIELKLFNKNLKIKLSKTDIFHNDLLTGGTTFFFLVKKNKNLKSLQMNLIKYFKRYIIKENNFKKFKKNSPEYISYKKYSFPYIGNHWIPHITICSVIEKKINSNFIKNFLRIKLNYLSIERNIHICRVLPKSLKIIKTINL